MMDSVQEPWFSPIIGQQIDEGVPIQTEVMLPSLKLTPWIGGTNKKRATFLSWRRAASRLPTCKNRDLVGPASGGKGSKIEPYMYCTWGGVLQVLAQPQSG